MIPPLVDFVVREDEAGLRLSVFLRRRGVSSAVTRGLKYLEAGILVNGQRARTSLVLAAGDRVQLCLPPEAMSSRPEAFTVPLVYQSQHALVLEKPAGMATHPDPSHHSGTLANAVCGLYQAQGRYSAFRPVGRLDTDTSGLVLCAQNAATAHLLTRAAQKLYLALLTGCPSQDEGLIDAPLGPKPGSSLRQCVCETGRPSRTWYRVLVRGKGASLVAVLPQTGRTHQIRAHFAHLGHPLLGDRLYGGSWAAMRRHALHCAGLRFTELSGNCPVLWSRLPPDMRAVALHLGLGEHVVPLPQLLQNGAG